MGRKKIYLKYVQVGVATCTFIAAGALTASAALPVPAGTIDPTTIPQFVTPLVIPPQMPRNTTAPPDGQPQAHYDIAVRQFKQQILPGGIWDTVTGRSDGFPATTVWSYGRAEDPLPNSSALGGGPGIAPAANSSFNYPAFTVEALSDHKTRVRWINDLKDPATGNYLPHLFAVDQTLHWANPPMACADPMRVSTDCRGNDPSPYTGPVPLVTHLHGAHVNSESDGYPEAWWLPNAVNIPADYATKGSLYDQRDKKNTLPGSALFVYENDQPATTLWYHDHALGMTRLNVYAGPAGFWLIRGGANGDSFVTDRTTNANAVLPRRHPVQGQDPNLDPAVRKLIREIPIAIQDRTFKSDGSLFYPDNRAFFEGLNDLIAAPNQFPPGTGTLNIPFVPDPGSDISPIWNPEAFFNTMVVNGTTWPVLDVAKARYRFRLLDGCNSRFLNLSMFVTGPGADAIAGTADDVLTPTEVPFYQIGADQGFLPNVVKVQTGVHTVFDGTPGGVAVAAPHADQALLLGPAERADVIVDFSSFPAGTRIRMINTGPDSPFGGFPVGIDLADPATTGRVMEFVVKAGLKYPLDNKTTIPENLVLPAEASLGAPAVTRQLSLNEEVSGLLCVSVAPDGTVDVIDAASGPNFVDEAFCTANNGVVFGPKAALLGTVNAGTAVPMIWMDPVTEAPLIGDTETWEVYNLTEDAHPIHLHLVRFEVLNRQALQIDLAGLPIPIADAGANPVPADTVEVGYKDTVISYPGQVTRIKAKFDRAGLYVWHCHIVEHEDNEMMRPYVVRHTSDINGDGCVSVQDKKRLEGIIQGTQTTASMAYDLNNDGVVDEGDTKFLKSNYTNPNGVACP